MSLDNGHHLIDAYNHRDTGWGLRYSKDVAQGKHAATFWSNEVYRQGCGEYYFAKDKCGWFLFPFALFDCPQNFQTYVKSDSSLNNDKQKGWMIDYMSFYDTTITRDDKGDWTNLNANISNRFTHEQRKYTFTKNKEGKWSYTYTVVASTNI